MVLENEVTIVVLEYPSSTALAMGWSGSSVTIRFSCSSVSNEWVWLVGVV